VRTSVQEPSPMTVDDVFDEEEDAPPAGH
jgi:hypothetical protein